MPKKKTTIINISQIVTLLTLQFGQLLGAHNNWENLLGGAAGIYRIRIGNRAHIALAHP